MATVCPKPIHMVKMREVKVPMKAPCVDTAVKGGTDKGTHQLVTVGDEHAQDEGPEDGPAHDAEETEGGLEHAGEVLDQEHHAVTEHTEAHGQQLGDEGGALLRQGDPAP